MNKRIIYIGADSAGYPLKEEIKEYLKGKGYEVHDMGTDSTASCHYPVFAAAVCENVQKNLDGSFGILVCGTGIGMSMCANKHKGIRAALCSDTYSAKMTRVHNDANVMCMGARVIGSCHRNTSPSMHRRTQRWSRAFCRATPLPQLQGLQEYPQ